MTDPISPEEANARLQAELEDLEEQQERERRHDDPSVEAELVDPNVRRRYKESGAFG
jgi:hypothetical protein